MGWVFSRERGGQTMSSEIGEENIRVYNAMARNLCKEDNYKPFFHWVQGKILKAICDNYKKEGSERLAEISARTILNDFIEMYGGYGYDT